MPDFENPGQKKAQKERKKNDKAAQIASIINEESEKDTIQRTAETIDGIIESIREEHDAEHSPNFHEVPDQFRDETVIAKEIVKKNPKSLMSVHCPSEIRDNQEVIKTAIDEGGFPRAIELASDRLKSDKDMLEFTARNGGLEFVSEQLNINKEKAIDIVRSRGLALQYVPENLRENKEVVLEAVRQNGYALEFASDKLKNDQEVVLEAVKQDKHSLQFASSDLKERVKELLAPLNTKFVYSE